jgi:hypothetical protein
MESQEEGNEQIGEEWIWENFWLANDQGYSDWLESIEAKNHGEYRYSYQDRSIEVR